MQTKWGIYDKQERAISSLNGSPLKLVDKFSSSVSSTECDDNMLPV